MNEQAIQEAIDVLTNRVNSLAIQQATFLEALDAHRDNRDDEGNTHLAPDTPIGDVFQADLAKEQEDREAAIKKAVNDAAMVAESAKLIETAEYVKAAKLGMIQQIHLTNGLQAGRAAWQALARWEGHQQAGPYPFDENTAN